jgi:DNA-binding response OmpR family regulator
MAPRVLVIDDDRDCRYYLAEGLRKVGYDVSEADGGIMGLDLFERKPFDLVVTDIVMPDREGTSLIVELRRRHPAVKVIAISGAGKSQYVDYLKMALNVGADKALEKPVKSAHLAACVRLLAGPPGRAS